MSGTIKLAKGLTVAAVEFATEVSANIGMRGGGKSNGAAVAVEQVIDAGVPSIVLDYVGIWWSLRLARDGKTPSQYQIHVLGGPHGDVAIAPTAGAVVAEALAARNSSAIIDLSLFSKGDRCRFATDFAEAFFAAKKRQPGPVLLVLEEAQRYIPQRVQPDQARMLGAFEEIAETGRNFGIGMLLISLRPQKLNKDVLNLADWVFAYRTNGKHERQALSDWMQENGEEDRVDMAGDLPSLPKGTPIVWCPVRRIYGRFEVPLKQTFDASATPVKALAEVKIRPLDLGELQAAMGRAVEDAKANDPRALRAEIARLQRELAAKPNAGPGPERKVEVPVVPKEWTVAASKLLSALSPLTVTLEGAATLARESLLNLEAAQKVVPTLPTAPTRVISTVRKAAVTNPPRGYQEREKRSRNEDFDQVTYASKSIGNSGLRRMLVALAQRPAGLTNRQIGVRAGVSSKSGTFASYLSRARTNGWIVDDGQVRRITDDGLRELGPWNPLPEGPDLARYWIHELGGGASRMLEALVNVYPDGLTRAELGEVAEISPASGTFASYLSRLRTLELVTGRDRLQAAEELAP